MDEEKINLEELTRDIALRVPFYGIDLKAAVNEFDPSDPDTMPDPNNPAHRPNVAPQPPSVRLRRGNPSDIEPAVVVWRAASAARHGGRPVCAEQETRLRGSMQKPDTFLHVADGTGEVVGMALAMQGLADDGTGPPDPGLCFMSGINSSGTLLGAI